MKTNKTRTESICIDNKFLYSTDVLYRIENHYKKREFYKALDIISKNIEIINIPSFCELSIFFDIIASILWKIGETDKAYIFWKKSYEIDKNNRHSKLSLDFLFDDKAKESYLCDLFINLKMNEFISNKSYCSEKEKKDMVKFLLDYWNKNLSNKNLSQFEDIDLVDYFISLKIF